MIIKLTGIKFFKLRLFLAKMLWQVCMKLLSAKCGVRV